MLRKDTNQKTHKKIDVMEKRQLPTPAVLIPCIHPVHNFICSQSENHNERANKRELDHERDWHLYVFVRIAATAICDAETHL